MRFFWGVVSMIEVWEAEGKCAAAVHCGKFKRQQVLAENDMSLKSGLRIAGFGLVMAMALPGVGQQTAAGAGPRTITFDAVVRAGSNRDTGFPRKAEDFTVLDNKQPVTPLAFHARRKGEDNVQVVVVVDDINIPAKWMGSVKQQVGRFLRENNGALAYPTAMAIVTDAGTSQTAFTLNGTRLADALDKQVIGVRDRDVEFTRGALVDRYSHSIARLSALVAGAEKWGGRTEVLWVSPGWSYLADPRGLPTDAEERQLFQIIIAFSTQMRKAGVTLNTIDPIGASESVLAKTYYLDFVKGVKKYTQVEQGDLTLQALSIQSGGQVVTSNDAPLAMEKCLTDLQEYYEFTIPEGPAEAPNTYHHLEVKVKETGLSVQMREGYYAQP
jgi:VWFA-related protein